MSEFKGVLRQNESLAPYTSWGIGGLARRYYRPLDTEDLLLFLKTCDKDEPLSWLGLGSNVLIADEGIEGTVIHTLGMKAEPIRRGGPSGGGGSHSCCSRRSFSEAREILCKRRIKGGRIFCGYPRYHWGRPRYECGCFW